MTRCETCGNDYENSFCVIITGRTHTFDSFECAIYALASICGHCGCRVVGHGVQFDEQVLLACIAREPRDFRGSRTARKAAR